jgi:hypothetical protein
MALPTLAEDPLREATRARLSRFSPELTRQWGTMTPGETVCHLAICYRLASGSVVAKDRSGPLQRTAFKYAALHVPLQWAHGYPTLTEVRAGAPGAIPGDFTNDRERLLADYDSFLSSPALKTAAHPIFGPLTQWEWMRWGYLHADHHLRQFGL